MPLTAGPAYAPPGGPVPIIHQDDAMLVVEKPAGLLSVPGKTPDLFDSLEFRLKLQVPGARLVHRLDMDTSGVMVFARTHAAQKSLGQQFERRSAKKEYQALVWGEVAEDEGRIDLPLIADWPNRPLQKICRHTGKPAVTDWKVLERSNGRTRLALYPLTGRSHQLRVHLKALGYPILGDRFYAEGAALEAVPRLCLHSRSLTLMHPEGQRETVFESDVPF